jgi:hypothetical protein
LWDPRKKGVQELKDKSIQGLPFGALAQEEVELLVRMFNDARGADFNLYFGATAFQLAHWTKDQLALVTILPRYKFELLARGVTVTLGTTFKQWADAMELAAGSGSPFAHDDPVTVSRYDGSTMLIDGYGRASSFWGTNEASSRIAVFVPE